MSYIFTFTPKESHSSKERIEDLTDQKDVQLFLKETVGHSITAEFKLTNKQSEKERLYRYYHKVVLSIAVQYYKSCGYSEADKVFCDYQLKAHCAKGIMYNSKTQQEEVFLLDKSRMNKKRLGEFVTDCITFLEVDCGYKVPDSQSYIAELQTGIKGFHSVGHKKD